MRIHRDMQESGKNGLRQSALAPPVRPPVLPMDGAKVVVIANDANAAEKGNGADRGSQSVRTFPVACRGEEAYVIA
jgi:hypothetical protein